MRFKGVGLREGRGRGKEDTNRGEGVRDGVREEGSPQNHSSLKPTISQQF
jgi:hypothetical protein